MPSDGEAESKANHTGLIEVSEVDRSWAHGFNMVSGGYGLVRDIAIHQCTLHVSQREPFFRARCRQTARTVVGATCATGLVWFTRC